MHERQAIREAIVEQLKAGTPSWGTRVFKSRVAPGSGVELPAVIVYAGDETIDADNTVAAPRELARDFQVFVESFFDVAEGDVVDDKADALGLQVETAMDADLTLDGTAIDSSLVRTTAPVMVGDDGLKASTRLEYLVEYQTLLRRPAPTDIFDVAGITTRTGEADAPEVVTDIHQDP